MVGELLLVANTTAHSSSAQAGHRVGRPRDGLLGEPDDAVEVDDPCPGGGADPAHRVMFADTVVGQTTRRLPCARSFPTTESPRHGSTSSPTCPRRCNRRCTPGPVSRWVPTTWHRCSRWRSSARRSAPSRGSTSRARCSTSCGRGGRPPWCAPQRLEEALQTPARIYYKDESVSPAGSHKPNTAVPQAFYNKAAGRHPPHHRDRRRSVGQRPGLRHRAVRSRVQGLHGAGLVRAEALSPRDDGGVGRRRRALPRRRSRPPRVTGLGHQRRRARRGRS